MQLEIIDTLDYRYSSNYGIPAMCGRAAARNPYLRLLCQLYKFLARRSESKFNKASRSGAPLESRIESLDLAMDQYL